MVMNKEKRKDKNRGLEWGGILTGPVAWLTQFEINYALVRQACISHSVLVLHLVSLFAFGIVGIAGLISVNLFRKTSQDSASREGIPTRENFMALLGIFSASLYGLAIIAQAIPGFILDPCER